MKDYLYVIAYVIIAILLLTIGLFSTLSVFKTEGFGAGITSVVAWLVAIAMLWFFGPQRRENGGSI